MNNRPPSWEIIKRVNFVSQGRKGYKKLGWDFVLTVQRLIPAYKRWSIIMIKKDLSVNFCLNKVFVFVLKDDIQETYVS